MHVYGVLGGAGGLVVSWLVMQCLHTPEEGKDNLLHHIIPGTLLTSCSL
jgi:hypothetical protein